MPGLDAKAGLKVKETEAELRGRLAALETLLAVTIAQLAERTRKPDKAIREIMANAEDMLERAERAAPAGERRAAEYARAAFDQVSDAMLAHLARRALPAGRG